MKRTTLLPTALPFGGAGPAKAGPIAGGPAGPTNSPIAVPFGGLGLLPVSLFLVLFLLLALRLPGIIDAIMDGPTDAAQHETLYRRALEARDKLKKRYGDTPVESWPDEKDRLTYENAGRLAEEYRHFRGRKR